MKIELISFSKDIEQNTKTNYFVNIVNSCQSDLLVFPGWTFKSYKHFESIQDKLKNKKSLIIFEINYPFNDGRQNRIFHYKKGKFIDTLGEQCFAETKDFKVIPDLIKVVIEQIKKCRIHDFNNLKLLQLQCGEVNILRSRKSENGRIEFRHNKISEKLELEDILSKIDIVVNPIHTAMSNQGNLKAKRLYYSRDKKVYCYTGNFDAKGKDGNLVKRLINSKSIQSCFYNNQELSGKIKEVDSEMIRKIYEVE